MCKRYLSQFLSKTTWSFIRGISTKWSFFLLKLSVQKGVGKNSTGLKKSSSTIFRFKLLS